MRNAQHKSQCQVFLHPTACSSRSLVDAIQRRTGRLIIATQKGNAQAVQDATAQQLGGNAA